MYKKFLTSGGWQRAENSDRLLVSILRQCQVQCTCIEIALCGYFESWYIKMSGVCSSETFILRWVVKNQMDVCSMSFLAEVVDISSLVQI